MGEPLKRSALALGFSLLTAIGIAAPAEAAGPDSWAHVWDADQTQSTSSSSYVHFADYCPDSFWAKVEFVRWGYGSPEGLSVNIKWTDLRITTSHKITLNFEGQYKEYPAGETTTNRFYDTGDTSPVAWDGSNAVSANYRLYYAPASNQPWACKHPDYLAGLKKEF